MGSVHRISCKKCGYNISINDGIGFLFPVVYRETVTKMKNGQRLFNVRNVENI